MRSSRLPCLCAVLGGLVLSSACGTNSQGDAQISRAPVRQGGVRGFVLASGGGKETAPTPTRTSLYEAAWQQLKANLAAGAKVGSRYCVLETSESAPANNSENPYFQSFTQMWLGMGHAATELAFFNFSSYAQASDASAVAALTRDCGVVHLPGGDQTAVRGMWNGTRLHGALRSLLQQGGGISGNSAGAAMLGTITYFPSDTASDEDTETTLYSDPDLGSDELQRGFLSDALADFPPLYVETHTEQRERAARALAMLAQFEARFGTGKPAGMAAAADIDTGVLVAWNASAGAWTGRVVGGRSVEFLFPSSNSRVGVTSSNYPFATQMRSHLLFKGGTVVLSGARAGTVLAGSEPASVNRTPAGGRCTGTLRRDVRGDIAADMDWGSQVTFDVRIRDVDGTPTADSRGRKTMPVHEHLVEASKAIDSLLMDSYVTGDLLAKAASGCGFWVPQSFNLDVGQRRNRLPAERYALAKGLAPFAVALPTGMDAVLKDSAKGIYSLERGSGPSSSSLIYDVRAATELGTATYVYKEYGASAPLATGTWQNGIVHLLVPRSTYSVKDGSIVLAE